MDQRPDEPKPHQDREELLTALARGGILLAALALIAGFLVATSSSEGRLQDLVGLLPLPWLSLPMLALAGYTLVLTLVDLGTGRAELTGRGFLGSYVFSAVDLVAELLLVLMIMVPVAAQAFTALLSCFFMAMTLAAGVWGWRWSMGRASFASEDLLAVIGIYLGVGAVLSVIVLLYHHLQKLQDRYLAWVHGLRRRCLDWARDALP